MVERNELSSLPVRVVLLMTEMSLRGLRNEDVVVGVVAA
jgi:hypothetical protein